MKHGSLFSGIGGFDLAAEWMGWENVFHCEWNEFGQRVLKHHFPKALSYADITETDFNVHRGRIDIITGGFPCQPYSSAGLRRGKEDDRHLWPEMLRAIREIQPRWVLGENVLGLVNWSGGLVFHEVQADLEAEGYEVQPFILPAASVNAPHRRDRVWFVAYRNAPNSEQQRLERQRGERKRCAKHREDEGVLLGSKDKLDERNAPDTDGSRSGQDHGQRKSELGDKGDTLPNWDNFPTEPPICSGDDGLSNRLDNITFPKWRNESIKAYGNAIVPQVAHQIFKAIEAYEESLLHRPQG